MNIRNLLIMTSLGILLAVALVSCDRSSPAPEIVELTAETPDLDHDHQAEAEVSDLDRPVGELFAADCEHQVKTFACNECRYEVGVVRVPASLVEGKLVETEQVERRAVDVTVPLTGEVRFDERRVGHVSPLVEGVVSAVHVKLGDRVRRGQALVELECTAVGQAQAEYLAAQGMLDLARRNLERVAGLRREAIASEKEFLQAQQEADAARIRADGARSQLARYGMSEAAVRALADAEGLGRLTLRSPLDGAVLAMHAVPGEVAGTGESLFTVGDHAVVWVWADLYERDISAVAGEQASQQLAATVTVKAYPGESFAGTVDLVSPSMDESSRTVKVRVEVPNPDGRLLAGMFADVALQLPGSAAVLALPPAAVLEDEGREFVFVHHHDDYYVRRPVKTGRTAAGWVEVVTGIDPGQTVVAEGAFLLKSDVLRAKMGAGCAD
ncbi:MAG: efflux RND transporter periplasmic adaptor subunit [bacterium]|nr:efflux RND transporter periplasmic adaptor subunit [bacterium]